MKGDRMINKSCNFGANNVPCSRPHTDPSETRPDLCMVATPERGHGQHEAPRRSRRRVVRPWGLVGQLCNVSRVRCKPLGGLRRPLEAGGRRLEPLETSRELHGSPWKRLGSNVCFRNLCLEGFGRFSEALGSPLTAPDKRLETLGKSRQASWASLDAHGRTRTTLGRLFGQTLVLEGLGRPCKALGSCGTLVTGAGLRLQASGRSSMAPGSLGQRLASAWKLLEGPKQPLGQPVYATRNVVQRPGKPVQGFGKPMEVLGQP